MPGSRKGLAVRLRPCPPARRAAGSSRPFRHRRHRRQNRLDVAAGAQAEHGPPVVEQVELDVASTAHQLLLALPRSPGLGEISPYQPGIDPKEGAADILGEGKIGFEIAAVEPIVEDAADAPHLAAVLEKKVFVAPRLELF